MILITILNNIKYRLTSSMINLKVSENFVTQKTKLRSLRKVRVLGRFALEFFDAELVSR